MKKLFLAAVCTLLLSACVTEEGAKKHAAKQHAAAADGLHWKATVYTSQRSNAKTETIGEFGSRTECMEMALKHLHAKGYTEGAYSCGA